jgi:hypothetical protein
MEGIDQKNFTYNRLLEENEAAKKRAEEEKAAAAQKKLEIKLAAERQAAERASPKKLDSSGNHSSRSLRRQTTNKVMSEEDRARMREKMRKLEDLAGEDDWATPLPNGGGEGTHDAEDGEYNIHQPGEEMIRPTSRSSDAFRAGTPDGRPPSSTDDRGSSAHGSERDKEKQGDDSDDDSETRRARSRRNQARTLRNLRSASSRGGIDPNSRQSLASGLSSPSKPGSPGFVAGALRSSTQRRILSRGTPKSATSSGGGSEGGLGDSCDPPNASDQATSNPDTTDVAQESNYTDIPDWHKFFGPDAKIEFRRKYRKIYRFWTMEVPA